MKKQKLVLLGATGSIGKSTLDVLRQNTGDFKVELLASRRNVEALKQAALEFGAAAVYFEAGPWNWHADVKEPLRIEGVEALLDYLARSDYDCCVFALTDFGLSARAIERVLSRRDRPIKVLLASKEAVVAFGRYFRRLAAANGHALIPLDSEPSAIFQCLGGGTSEEGNGKLRKIYLTATGGPFYRGNVDLDAVTPQQALKHPVWNMGPKITVDSATLVNKALELLEISQLFDVPAQSIRILIHPECVFHSMVEMANGSVLAQMGPADMRLPIHYGLYWPKGFAAKAAVPPLDFGKISQLCLDRPDLGRFPCLRVALERVACIEQEGRSAVARIAFMAADEACVESFLEGRLRLSAFSCILSAAVDKALAEEADLMVAGPKDVERGIALYDRIKRQVRNSVAGAVLEAL